MSRPRNVIELLKEDHKKVKGLLERLRASTERAVKTRQELLAKLAEEIEIHTAVEEEIFYPAVKEKMQTNEELRLYFEAMEEHRAADVVLNDLRQADPATPQFGGKAKVLEELITHHADEEEEELFPQAEELLDEEELLALGAQVTERKRAGHADPKREEPRRRSA